MILAIDIGNTNIVFGLFDGETLTKKWRAPTKEPFSLTDINSVKAVIVTSVVPHIDATVTLSLIHI